MDVGLFGVEVFVKGGAKNTVGVEGQAEVLQKEVYVGVVSEGMMGKYLRSPPSLRRSKRLPPVSIYFLRELISVFEKLSLGEAMMNRLACFMRS